jgi:cytochrome P450
VPRSWPAPANRRATRARRSLERVVDQLIGKRRATGGPGGQDLLGRLLGARDLDTGAGLDDAELRAQVLLFPPAYGIARRTGQDEVIGGHLLPAGSILLVSTWVLHRPPPPLGPPGRLRPRPVHPPSGRPPATATPTCRLAPAHAPCIGGSFALLEAVLATAMIVRAYRLQTTPGPNPLAAGITLRPATAVPCTLRPIPTAHQSGPT